ncbi:hypothetical protein ACFOD4_18965 [Pseudoroseomonas globiformis]|uniref:Uncharacterized protein n=1 Tax=Teichococcus globiformis TaxID=2307229 RepID=A0ABV7G363_9PROT
MRISTSLDAEVLLDELTQLQYELTKMKGKLLKQHRECLRGSPIEDDVERVTRGLDSLSGAIERLTRRRGQFIGEIEAAGPQGSA